MAPDQRFRILDGARHCSTFFGRVRDQCGTGSESSSRCSTEELRLPGKGGGPDIRVVEGHTPSMLFSTAVTGDVRFAATRDLAHPTRARPCLTGGLPIYVRRPRTDHPA